MDDDVLVTLRAAAWGPSRPRRRGAHVNFDFGFPPGVAETVALSLEGRCESYTLGKRISLAQTETIAALAPRHGFCLAGRQRRAVRDLRR